MKEKQSATTPKRSSSRNAKRNVNGRSSVAARRSSLVQRPSSIPHGGNIAQFELDNGIRVLAYENFASPAVVVNGYFQAGSVDEPAEKAGLAGFVADCLTRGTQKFSYEALFEKKESLSANLSVNGGTFTSSVFTKSLAEDLPTMLDLLASVIRQPTFPADEIEKERAEWMSSLQERANNTRAMASLAFYEHCYPSWHPFHSSNDGYLETARRISRDDVVNFHKAYYAPEDMVFVVVGAVRADDARRFVQESFGDWQSSRPKRTEVGAPPKIEGKPSKHVLMPGKSQSNITLGFPGPTHSDPDWVACTLMNSVLGQFGMYGRLGESVRKYEGLVYYIGSRFDGGVHAGPWSLYAGTNPNTIDRVVELSLAEMKRIREKKIKTSELEDNQRYFTGVMPLQMETNEGIAGQILNMVRYKRGLDWLKQYPDKVNAVTLADVQRVAQKWLDTENYVLVTAGA
jgi:zinc protease